LSSQLGQVKASTPVQPNPYANVPGYRPDEPANSAWNRTILAYKSAGVPYSIERQETGQAPITKETPSNFQLSGLGTSQSSSSSKSTNPEYESLLMESFAKNTGGFKDTNYFNGLFEKGILTSSDYDKLNQIVTNYNQDVSAKNAKNQADYELALKNYSADVIYQARKEGANSIHIFDSSGKTLDTIPTKSATDILPLALQSFAGKDVYASTKSNQQILSLRQEAGQSNKAYQKQLSDSLYNLTSQGYIIKIKDNSGKTLKETSGARAYHDVLQAQKQYGNNISYDAYFPARSNLANVQKSDFIKDPLGTLGEFFGGAVKTGETIAAQQIASFYSAAKAPTGKSITTQNNFLGISIPLPNENFIPAYANALKQQGKGFISSGVNVLEQIGRAAPYLGIPVKESINSLVSVLPSSFKQSPNLAPEASAFAKQYSSSTAYDIMSGQKTTGLTQAGLAGSLSLAVFLTAEPIVEAVPLRGAGLGIGVRSLETGKEVSTPSRTLLFGYGGKGSIPLFSYVNGKIVKGAPKPEQVVPNNFKITSFGRGTQITGKSSGWETKYLTNQVFLKDLETRGKLIQGSADVVKAHESIFKTSKGVKDETPKTIENLLPEKYTTASKEATYSQLGKQQGMFSWLSPSGRVGKLGGSGALFLSLPDRFQKAMGQPKDIDVHVSSIFGENFAALRLTSKLAKKANKSVENIQGNIIENPKVVNFKGRPLKTEHLNDIVQGLPKEKKSIISGETSDLEFHHITKGTGVKESGIILTKKEHIAITALQGQLGKVNKIKGSNQILDLFGEKLGKNPSNNLGTRINKFLSEPKNVQLTKNVLDKAYESVSKVKEGPKYENIGRDITATGKGIIPGKALEIPNPKSKEPYALLGSSTGSQEIRIFNEKISTRTIKPRISSTNRQRVTFVSGAKQLADQIRTSVSIQTRATIEEQMRTAPGIAELARGAKEKLKGSAAFVPPAFRVKDLVRETLKTEHYAEQFEKKGELGKAMILRENIRTVKGYAEQIYKIDWAKLESEVIKEPVKFENPTSIFQSAKNIAPNTVKGFRTSSPFIQRPTPNSNLRTRGVNSMNSISSNILSSPVISRNRLSSFSTRSRFNTISGSNKNPIRSQRPSQTSQTSTTFSSIMKSSGSPSKSPSSKSSMSPFSSITRPPSSSPSRSPAKSPYSPFSTPPSRPPSSPPSPSPSSPPSSPPSTPPSTPPNTPPSKKRFPGVPFFDFNPENGPGSPVGGGGLKKNFLGNVPEFAFTGMFNKTEIKYAKAGGIPREYKSGKPAFNAFTKASGQQAGGKQKITAKSQESSFLFDKFSSQGKKSSKQSKPLSNKFNRLI